MKLSEQIELEIFRWLSYHGISIGNHNPNIVRDLTHTILSKVEAKLAD